MSKSRSSRRLRFSHLFVVILLILAVLLYREISKKPDIPERDVVPAGAGIKVVDGDTFSDSEGNTIRLLGIDTPEKGQPFAREAEVALQEMLNSGSQLRYEYGKERRDRYQRTLAFVYVDTVFVNERLVEEGLAAAYFFEGQLANAAFQELCAAQRSALRLKLGIWSLPAERPDTAYFGNTESRRFHRSTCDAVTSGESKHLIRRDSREEFLDECYSPCRNCKP